MALNNNVNGHWLASDAVSPNETYVGQRLMYQRFADVEHGLTDSVSEEVARSVLRRLFRGTAWIMLVLVALIVLQNFGGTGDFGSVLAVLVFLAMVAWIVVTLAMPVIETLSEWHLLLDGRAALAESAYAVVLRSLRDEHQIPAHPQVRRMRVGPPMRGVRNFLLIRMHSYHMYVSVFAFGQDLFLGWTLRRKQNSLRIVLRWFMSLFAGDPGFADLIDVEPVKAMRDAVHNALRQSIEAAAMNQHVTIVETFGQDIPIQNIDPQDFAAQPVPLGPESR